MVINKAQTLYLIFIYQKLPKKSDALKKLRNIPNNNSTMFKMGTVSYNYYLKLETKIYPLLKEKKIHNHNE